MKCSKCGTELPDDALFCASCGAKTEQPSQEGPVCPQCGGPLKPGARFCGVCGHHLSEAKTTDTFCSQCASRLKPGSQFCPSCGARQAGSAPPVSPSPVQTPYTPAAYRSYAANGNPYQPAPVKKKKKKGLLVALVVVLIIAVAGGGAIALFGNDIKKVFMGPKATYLMIDRDALYGHVDDLIENLARYGNKSDREKGGFDLDLTIIPAAGALEGEFEIDPQMVEILENIRFKNKMLFDRSTDNPRVYNLLDLLNSDGRVMTLEVLYADEEMLIHVPDVFDQYMVANADETSTMLEDIQFELPDVLQGLDIGMMSGMMSGSGDLDLGIDEKELDKTLTKIVDIVMENIDNCELSKDVPLRAGNLSANYDMYEMSITTQSARKMMIEILERLKDDREFYKLFTQIAAAVDAYEGGYGEEISFEEFQEEIQNALDELNDPENDDTNFTITQKLYVDKDDQVVGRDLVIVDDRDETLMNFRYAQPARDNQEAYLLALDTDTENFEFLASYTVRDDRKTGSGVLSGMGSDILKIEFADYTLKEIGSMEWPLGSFDITIFETDLLDGELPPEIQLSVDDKGDQLAISLAIPDMVSLDMLYSEIEAGDAAIPAMTDKDRVWVDDDEAMNSLMTPDAEEKMMEILEKLGIDPEMLN